MVKHLDDKKVGELKFTPLEFETDKEQGDIATRFMLKFTPLEFETLRLSSISFYTARVKIYSVGV